MSYKRRLREVGFEAVRRPGVFALRAVRRLPLMKSRIIPWLVRQEIDEIPAAGTVRQMRRELRAAAESDLPIVVGPWLSEVGFEVLYWIPFLNWVVQDLGLPPDRLIAVTRGGAGVWYGDLADRQVDIFDLMSLQEFRDRNEARWADAGRQKQMGVTDLDRHIVRAAEAHFGLGETAPLHPSVMYKLLRFYWYEKSAVSLLLKNTEYRRLPPVDGVELPDDLPKDYVAVRFYFRPSFPDNAENRDVVRRVIRTLADRVPVVLLNTGLSLDDHDDFDPGVGRGIHSIDHLMTPSRNLEVQSAVISRARAFVGTYGGLAYLGPFYGVPSVALYSHEDQIVPAHMDVSRRLGRLLDTPLTMLHTRELEQVGMILTPTTN